MARKTVLRYDKAAGRITVHVSDASPTVGTFDLILENDSRVVQEVDGSVPSAHELDAEPAELGTHKLKINGKYAPVEQGAHVHITYVFKQQNTVIHRTVIDEEPGERGFYYSGHRYAFQPKDGVPA